MLLHQFKQTTLQFLLKLKEVLQLQDVINERIYNSFFNTRPHCDLIKMNPDERGKFGQESRSLH